MWSLGSGTKSVEAARARGDGAEMNRVHLRMLALEALEAAPVEGDR